MNHDHHGDHHETAETFAEYLKFSAVIFAIILISALLTARLGWTTEVLMANIMGVFFIVFGLFKLLGYKMFVITYAGYDIIAKKYRLWAYAFPFVELLLGFGYIFLQNNLYLNIVTILITATAGVGVLREVSRKSAFKCACLGTIIKLPLSKVSFVEDFAMMAMAGLMIFI